MSVPDEWRPTPTKDVVDAVGEWMEHHQRTGRDLDLEIQMTEHLGKLPTMITTVVNHKGVCSVRDDRYGVEVSQLPGESVDDTTKRLATLVREMPKCQKCRKVPVREDQTYCGECVGAAAERLSKAGKNVIEYHLTQIESHVAKLREEIDLERTHG